MLRNQEVIPIIVDNSPISEVLESVGEPFIARTSDRILFKKCRRLWGWMSPNAQGRRMLTEADYLWFGTGMHYALEDYHGINVYSHPALAFKAYVIATGLAERRPPNWRDLEIVGMGMMSYYAEHFLKRCGRDPYNTYIWENEYQVEVNAHIDLGINDDKGRRLLYGFTLDRVIIDEFGMLWIVEYKSAKQFRIFHLDIDDQITAYCWAAWRYYGQPVAGVIYQQHKKNVPMPPRILSTGRISHDARQHTSAILYGDMLKQFYGEIKSAPNQNIIMYNNLLHDETEDSDKYVLRHKVERNMNQLRAFEQKLLMELEDMTRPDLPLYPNPGKDCSWSCPLMAACIAIDSGDDWENILNAYTFFSRTVAEEQIKWRLLLPQPQQINLPLEAVQYHLLVQQLQQLEAELQQQSPQESENQESPTAQFLEELGFQM